MKKDVQLDEPSTAATTGERVLAASAFSVGKDIADRTRVVQAYPVAAGLLSWVLTPVHVTAATATADRSEGAGVTDTAVFQRLKLY